MMTNATPVPERTLVELFRRQANSRANSPAMFHRDSDHWTSIAWSVYAEQARSLAAFFISAGLKEQEHVAIWSFNRPEFLVASTATMLARACTAPLYQTLSAAEAAYVLSHSDAPIAVVENHELLARVLVNARQLNRGLHDLGFDVVEPSPVTDAAGGEHSIITPIVPVRVGEDWNAGLLWRALWDAGVFTNVAVHPAVPPGGALLRTSVMATHTPEVIEAALDAFARVKREFEAQHGPLPGPSR